MSNSVKYPDHLNPFGDEEDEVHTNGQDDYPDHLDPFGDDENDQEGNIHLKNISIPVDDYDDSLNPFGDEEHVDESQKEQTKDETQTDATVDSQQVDGNPFGDDSDQIESPPVSLKSIGKLEDSTNDEIITADKISSTPQPQSLESLEPPKPLPRTKSLLKKELALKRHQQEQQNHQQPSPIKETNSNHQLDENNSQSIDSTTNTSSASNKQIESFQRKKNKRVAPPVPVNFKRQVSGSLDVIEEELNNIGDQLTIIEKESNLCQETLKLPDAAERAEFPETRAKFIELIKRKNSIIRRQKELMYRKRELKLDQIHSDIEYELRMIGNKQLSSRTSADEAKEKELLKKLVEIVEEKNDIVENLNKDTSCDNQDTFEAFRRLNLSEHLPTKVDTKLSEPSSTPPTRFASKKENCDKVGLSKLSKIATLLPKSNTIKGTIKIKRINSEKSKKEDDKPGHPCICNGTFYKSCPKASECSENTSRLSHSPKRKLKHNYDDQFDDGGHYGQSNYLDNFDLNYVYGGNSNAHDDSHPDHVDIPPIFHGSANSGLGEERYLSFDSTSGAGSAYDLDTDTRHVERHRKVYVSKKKSPLAPIINPITITIPLKIPEEEAPLPPPKPLFQYKKYTTYETKPEIHMVPVTKTIIRPADVTPDQIVDENGQNVSRDFDARKI